MHLSDPAVPSSILWTVHLPLHMGQGRVYSSETGCPQESV